MVQTAEIKRLIAAAGLTAASVAEILGIAQSTLSLKLSGQRGFRPDELIAIRDVLNARAVLKRLGRRRPLTLDDLVRTGRAA